MKSKITPSKQSYSTETKNNLHNSKIVLIEFKVVDVKQNVVVINSRIIKTSQILLIENQNFKYNTK